MFKATFISNIKRWWWIPALNTALMLLGFFVYLYDGSYIYLDAQFISNSFMAALCALMLFSFLHTDKAAGLYYSLPSKKISIFMANILFGFLSILFCSLCFTAAYIIWAGSYYDLISDFFGTLTYATSIFALVTLVSMFTGNTLAAGIFSLLMYVMPLYINSVISELTDEIYGFAGHSTSVIYKLYDFDYPIRNLGFTAALLLLAYIAYRLRPAETAGELVTFRWARTLFIQGAALCVGLLISGTFMYIGTNYIVLAITGLITAAAAMMLMQKSFRIKGYPLQAGIFIVIVALLYVFIPMDITGYENRVPAAEDIASVTVNDGRNIRYVTVDYNHASLSNVILETPEDIAAAIEVHNRIVSERPEEDSYWKNLSLRYELKNGKTLERHYSVPADYITEIANTVPFRLAYFQLDKEWYYVQLRIELDDSNSYKHVMLLPEEITAMRTAINTDALSCAPNVLYEYDNSQSYQSEYLYVTYYLYDGHNKREFKSTITINESMPTAWPLAKELLQKYGASPEGKATAPIRVKVE